MAGNQNWNTQLQGTDVDCRSSVRGMDQGSFLMPIDDDGPKVVARQHRATSSSTRREPGWVGHPIQNQPFTIVGVLASKGQSGGGQIRTTAFAPTRP
jgi:putative ABC transport system permease protein